MASKRKGDAIRETVKHDVDGRDVPKKPIQAAEDGRESIYKTFRSSDKETLSTRIETRYKRIIEGYARERGLKTSQVVSMWIHERMKAERLI